MIRIVEIISRSEQGITRPFLCRGDNGKQYFVKASGAGRRALIAEWISGKVGSEIGLPIPPFEKVDISPDLIRFSARDDIHDLGAGIGFASERVENVDELSYVFIEQVEPELRARILLFDWWIRNGDRTLTENGGNPNLLWQHLTRKLSVIDQNLAFDGADTSGFWDEHIFARDWELWSEEFQQKAIKEMRNGLRKLDQWWHEMPGSWLEVESGLTLDTIQKMLWRFENESDIFWRRQ